MDNAHNDAKREHRPSIAEYEALIESLTASEARYRELFENANDLMFMVNLEGRFTDLNRAVEETTGFSRDELLGAEISVVVPPEFVEKVREAMRHKVRTHERTRYEIEILAKDGRHIPVEIGSRLIHLNGEPIIQGIARDMSEHKRAEIELREAKEAAEGANRAKSSFLANMSHEIRTPLNAVLGMTELLADTDLSPEQREYVEMVYESGETLLALIKDILDFSKIEAGKLEFDHQEFDLRDSLASTMKSFAVPAHEKHLELAFHCDANVPDILVGDVNRVRQVIINLVSNAIKFTEAGEVVLNVSCDTRATRRALLHFSVRDTGIGVSEEEQERIFHAFEQADVSTTRRFGGTGLGLTISVRLVDLMGGRLWVDRNSDQGSTFHFTAELECATGAPPSQTVPDHLIGTPVLVVDDNATSLHILEETLTKLGLQPVCVANASDALTALRNANRTGTPFPLIVSDVDMPEQDGMMLAAIIKHDDGLRNAHIILLTSGSHCVKSATYERIGVTRHLLKPVGESELFGAILTTLESDVVERASTTPLQDDERGHMDPLRILLAEDSIANQKLAIGLLAKEGHDVVVANNGREAVELTTSQEFDAVLMDVNMPEMDGFEATRLIRDAEKDSETRIPIIAMTAHAMIGDREKCLAAGMDDYIAKPIRSRVLSEMLASLAASTESSGGKR